MQKEVILKTILKSAEMILLLCLLLCFSVSASAQENDSAKVYNNAMYIDVAGAGGLTSINYEHTILKRQFVKVQTTIGLSTFKVIDYTRRFNPDLIVPISANVILGKHRHRLVAGLGSTIANITMARPDGKIRHTSINWMTRLGYRNYNRLEKMYWQLAYTPLYINRSGGWRHWGSFTVAFKF